MNRDCSDRGSISDNKNAKTCDQMADLKPFIHDMMSQGRQDCLNNTKDSTTRIAQEDGILEFSNIFDKLDTNKNGSLDRTEFKHMLQLLMGITPGDSNNSNGGQDQTDCKPPVSPKPPCTDHPPISGKPPLTDRPPITIDPPKPPIGDKPPVTDKPPITDKPPVQTGRFNVHDGKIFGPSGNEFQPRGVDVDNVSIALQDVNRITGDWSANMIRLSPNTNKDPYGTPTYDRQLLAKTIEEYTKRGVVVELTDGLPRRWGEILSDKELAGHAKFYSDLATQFKDNPYVWFASPNEAGNSIQPGSAQDKAWIKEALTMANAVRATGNQNPIVQGDNHWGQGSTGGGVSALLRHADEFKKIGNVIAGQHIYNNRNDAYQKLSSSIDDLRDEGFAVMIDEVSSVNWAGPGQPVMDVSNGSDAALKAVEDKDVGMLAFRWFESNKNLAYNLTVNGRGTGALTEWGKEVWHMTHGD